MRKTVTKKEIQDYKKQAMFDTGIYLLGMADEALETEKLKQAIKELEILVYMREHLWDLEK